MLLLAAAILAMAFDYPRPDLTVDPAVPVVNVVAHAQATAADRDALSCRTDAGEIDSSVAGDRCCRLAGTCAVNLPPMPVDVGLVLAASPLSIIRGERAPPGPAYRYFKPPRLQIRA
ncbi:hypothetical protein [Roseitalea porphyridii]|uniref:DUF2946 domain-containing protein n=1 Tax=Roseitalea porphyridii TaxID=1852022 RepID=A0A4V1A499_9HYPH|nr:hypothetical protein [Roseitalea porphyridii]QBK31878.1 hypothetical protein E0E05_15495 [Roseitalea porphyridii]